MYNLADHIDVFRAILPVFTGVVVTVLVAYYVLTVILHSTIIRSLFLKNHIVILGSHEILFAILKKISSDPEYRKTKILIRTTASLHELQQNLSCRFPESFVNRILLFGGCGLNPDSLRDLKLDNASCLYIIGESSDTHGGGDDHDARCLQVLDNVAKVLSEDIEPRASRLTTFLILHSYITCTIFNTSDVSPVVNKVIDLNVCNQYILWAQNVVIDNRAGKYNYIPLDGEGINTESKEHVHLVVMGATDIGLAMALQALYTCHYPNFSSHEGATRTRISVIAPDADRIEKLIQREFHDYFDCAIHRYVDLTMGDDVPWVDPMADQSSPYHYLYEAASGNIIDNQIEFVKADLLDPCLVPYLEGLATQPDTRLTIAVCYDTPRDSLIASTYMPMSVYNNVQQIYVYCKNTSAAIDNLTSFSLFRPDSQRYKKLVPFGMLEDTLCNGTRFNSWARKINAFYYDVPVSDTKTADELWKGLPVALKLSNIFCAISIPSKFRSIGVSTMCDIDQISDMLERSNNFALLASNEHNRWNTEKLLVGFRPLTKDEYDQIQSLPAEEKKQMRNYLKKGAERAHYCLVPEAMLDRAEKLLDDKLVSTIPDLIRNHPLTVG